MTSSTHSLGACYVHAILAGNPQNLNLIAHYVAILGTCLWLSVFKISIGTKQYLITWSNGT